MSTVNHFVDPFGPSGENLGKNIVLNLIKASWQGFSAVRTGVALCVTLTSSPDDPIIMDELIQQFDASMFNSAENGAMTAKTTEVFSTAKQELVDGISFDTSAYSINPEDVDRLFVVVFRYQEESETDAADINLDHQGWRTITAKEINSALYDQESTIQLSDLTVGLNLGDATISVDFAQLTTESAT